ncbi:MAG: hypothetical protein QOF28_3101 [Actinomycetota bacterium]|nr:hypothetical protein [Actinomycetota bacterium]
MPDVFVSLAQDHRDVEQQFERYGDSPDDAVAREIGETLTVHSEVEEHVLYPEIRRLVDGGDDLVDDAQAEHAAIATLIARLYDAPPPDLRPLIKELQQQVSRHIASEESELFPLLRDSGADAEALGARAELVRAEASSRSSG